VRAQEERFQGEPAIALSAGGVTAVFLPHLGMTGVSLRFPRPGALRYEAGGVPVDLDGLALRTDRNGLPIHGLLVGSRAWQVSEMTSDADTATLRAAIVVDARAFPFPHRIEVELVVAEARLEVSTTVMPTGDRAIPVAFGWHPYLQLPDTARAEWALCLPAREHFALDARGIPTGSATHEPSEVAPIGARTFDDLYAVAGDQVLALVAPDGAAIELQRDAGYPYAQVWVPPNREFAALEPMTVRTNALGEGDTPLVAPGDAFRARFTLAMRNVRD